MKTIPLHEAVRPNCHPDHAGETGQNMHTLADTIKDCAPELTIAVTDDDPTNVQHWQSVVAGLKQIRSVDRDAFSLAITHITELAQAR